MLSEVHEQAGVAVLNRPKALNALNTNMVERLFELYQRWDADPGVACFLLKASAGCSGVLYWSAVLDVLECCTGVLYWMFWSAVLECCNWFLLRLRFAACAGIPQAELVGCMLR